MYKRTLLEKRYQASTHQTDGSPNPAAEKAQGLTLQQALNLIAKHDERVRAAANTVQFHIDRGRHLVQKFGAQKLCAEIDVPALEQYTDARLAEDPDRHTIQKEHHVLRQALRLAKKAGFYLGEPSALVVEGFDGDTRQPSLSAVSRNLARAGRMDRRAAWSHELQPGRGSHPPARRRVGPRELGPTAVRTAIHPAASSRPESQDGHASQAFARAQQEE
jgi:hypothetical protein